MIIKTKILELEIHRADIYLKAIAFGWTYEAFKQFWRGGLGSSEFYRSATKPMAAAAQA